MTALRWTGKAFKLVGELLTAETFEKWVEAEGKAFVETHLKGIIFKFLFGPARAKNALRREIQAELSQSDVLRAALTRELDQLPALLSNGATFMHDKKGPDFHVTLSGGYLAAVPRVLTRNDIRQSVMDALGDAAELKRFTGLPSLFLERTAGDAEQAFFTRLGKGAPVDIHDSYTFVIGVDVTFDWRIGKPVGHYYVAHSYTRRENKKDRKEFLGDLPAALEALKAKLGSLQGSRLEAFANSFTVA